MQFSAKAIRMAEVLRKMESYDLDIMLKEFHRLLDTLFSLHETLSELRIEMPEWKVFSDTLMTKFYFHSYTFYNILHGIQIKSEYFKNDISDKKVIDIASARIILRAQMEAFFMYHHIYVNPKDDHEKELRYMAWIYTSIFQRNSMVVENDNFVIQQRAKDKIAIQEMRKRIGSLSAFKNLSPKQQKALLDKGNGKLFKSWDAIMKDTGFAERHPISRHYWLLSAYAHSEGVSILQIKQSNRTSINQTANADLLVSIQLICAMIISVRQLFKIIEIQYNGLPQELQDTIEIYASMAQSKRNL